MQTITLVASNSAAITVPVSVARFAGALRPMLQDDIPGRYRMDNIDEKSLERSMHFCLLLDGEDTDIYINNFKAEISIYEKTALHDLLKTADFLQIKPLLDMCISVVGDRLVGMTLRELQLYFDIINDLNDADINEMLNDNRWAFQGNFFM